MLLKFIGEDGSMGLRHGDVYECNIATIPPYVWIAVRMPSGGSITCPYSSLRMLQAEWQEV